MNPNRHLTIGRIVRYVIPSGCAGHGVIVPAIITAVAADEEDHEAVGLQPFVQGTECSLPFAHAVACVRHDERVKAPGTWHWPPDPAIEHAAREAVRDRNQVPV